MHAPVSILPGHLFQMQPGSNTRVGEDSGGTVLSEKPYQRSCRAYLPTPPTGAEDPFTLVFFRAATIPARKTKETRRAASAHSPPSALPRLFSDSAPMHTHNSLPANSDRADTGTWSLPNYARGHRPLDRSCHSGDTPHGKPIVSRRSTLRRAWRSAPKPGARPPRPRPPSTGWVPGLNHRQNGWCEGGPPPKPDSSGCPRRPPSGPGGSR